MTPDWPFPKPKPPANARSPIELAPKILRVRTVKVPRKMNRLSPMQTQIMDLICEGKTTSQISVDIGVTKNGISQHLMRIRKRLGAGKGRLHVAIARYFILRAGLKLPLQNSGRAYVDADGKPIEASQMVAAINAVAEMEA